VGQTSPICYAIHFWAVREVLLSTGDAHSDYRTVSPKVKIPLLSSSPTTAKYWAAVVFSGTLCPELFGPSHFVGLGLRLKSEIRTRTWIEISEFFCEMLTSLQYKCVNKQTRWFRVWRVFKVRNFRTRTSEKSADSDSDVRKALIAPARSLRSNHVPHFRCGRLFLCY
jgi:hypothetical protein